MQNPDSSLLQWRCARAGERACCVLWSACRQPSAGCQLFQSSAVLLLSGVVNSAANNLSSSVLIVAVKGLQASLEDLG